MPAEEDDATREARNLVTLASSTKDDLYALLSLSASSPSDITPSILKKAWRDTALICHPDKNLGNEKLAADKLDEARKAFNILSDPAARAAYDDRQRAAREKKERDAAFEGKRRKMKEDLERRESSGWSSGSPGASGVKRRWEEETPEEKRNRELIRLAADGARRRQEREDRLRKEREVAVRKQEEADTYDHNDPFFTAARVSSTTGTAVASSTPTNVSEVDRTIKVRWLREGVGLGIGRTTLSRMFSRFGAIESTILLKDKRARPSLGASPNGSLGEEKRLKKQNVGTGVIIFNSIIAAHAAVQDSMHIAKRDRNADPEWGILDYVSWASGQEPDFGFNSGTRGSPDPSSSSATIVTPSSTPHRRFPGLSSNGAAVPETPPTTTFTPKPDIHTNGQTKSKTSSPSFSFTASKPAAGQNSSAPSLFEMTMMRLREAEKRRLEEAILRDEAAATEAEAVG